MSIKYLEELEEDITNFIELFADKPIQQLAQKEDKIDVNEIKEVRLINGD